MLYQAIIIHTRPDTAYYAVNMLRRFIAHPTYSACRIAVRLLYTRFTVEYSVQKTRHELMLIDWTDSDWGREIDIRRSTTSNVVTLIRGLILYISYQQKIVTTSSTGS